MDSFYIKLVIEPLCLYKDEKDQLISFIFEFPDVHIWCLTLTNMNELLCCLLIDNDEDDREIFSLALNEVDPNCKCIAVGSGQEGLNLLLKEPLFYPAFIFIDMNMPGMDGKACLQAIKKIDHLKNIPVYMYSTAADPRIVEGLKQLGITDFLIKPAKFDELALLLKKVIYTQHA